MIIHQFEDKNLAHFSYAILSNGEIALIDTARNPQPYYDFAKQHEAKITAVIETHPHADFVSSHLEIHQTTGATIYTSKLVGADYPHQSFDDGNEIHLGNIKLQAINTPGHSPDSISILAIDETGKQKAVFTGDTLFIGDCGRPDLREKAGAITAAREQLASQMYYSLRNKLMVLNNDVVVYPAHGAGSLCGKGLSAAGSSTIGAEKMSNWSLQQSTEKQFIENLLADQPFIPKYFPYDVSINKKGAEAFLPSMNKIKIVENFDVNELQSNIMIIDTRPQLNYKNGHLPGAINLMNDTKFETWLGSIINPEEPFYLIGETTDELKMLIERIAKIGYENQILKAFVYQQGEEKAPVFDAEQLRKNPSDFTIVDIRNTSEVKTQQIFKNTLNIPLHELRERFTEIPTQKPIVVHCAGGYRSAAGSSLLSQKIKNTPVYDLSEAIKTFN